MDSGWMNARLLLWACPVFHENGCTVHRMRVPGIQDHNMRLVNRGRHGLHAQNPHCVPPHRADDTLPHVLLLDIFGDRDAVGAQCRSDQIKVINRVGDDRGVPRNPKEQATTAGDSQYGIVMSAVLPGAVRIGRNHASVPRIPQGGARDPEVCHRHGRGRYRSGLLIETKLQHQYQCREHERLPFCQQAACPRTC